LVFRKSNYRKIVLRFKRWNSMNQSHSFKKKIRKWSVINQKKKEKKRKKKKKEKRKEKSVLSWLHWLTKHWSTFIKNEHDFPSINWIYSKFRWSHEYTKSSSDIFFFLLSILLILISNLESIARISPFWFKTEQRISRCHKLFFFFFLTILFKEKEKIKKKSTDMRYQNKNCSKEEQG